MTVIAQTLVDRQTARTQRAHPFLRVIAWEVRRLRASRAAWVTACVTFAVLLFILWVERGISSVAIASEKGGAFFGGDLASDSVWRLLNQLTTGVLSLLTLALPFACTDAIARDWKRRTHELVMTTALRSWAYFWGRYVVVLLISLGLAVLLLAALLIMTLATHLVLGGADYPAPHLGLILAVWASLVLPLVILVSSLSFALGTLLPRHTNLIKIGIIVIWFFLALILPDVAGPGGSPPVWYTNWDPTSATLLAGVPDRYHRAFQSLVHAAGLENQPQTAATNAQVLQILHTLEYQFVDLWGWLGPHLAWTGLVLALVLIARAAFQRFRNISG